MVGCRGARVFTRRPKTLRSGCRLCKVSVHGRKVERFIFEYHGQSTVQSTEEFQEVRN